MVNKVTFVGFS